MEIPFLRPIWAEINLAAYGRNLQKIRAQVGPDVKILSVLKANAYGHGAVQLGLYAQRHRLCDFFGAASGKRGFCCAKPG